MKYMLLVHHDEEAFAKRDESERQQLLQESVQLANRLHSDWEISKCRAAASEFGNSLRSGPQQ